jgi:hypothetical protein
VAAAKAKRIAEETAQKIIEDELAAFEAELAEQFFSNTLYNLFVRLTPRIS